MAHRKVSIYVYGKTPDGNWKYLKLANGTNNKIRPGFGLIRGTATKLDSYRYVLNVAGRWYPAGDTPIGWVIDHSRTKSRRTGENKFIRLKAWLVWAGHKVVASKNAPAVPQQPSVHVLTDELLAKFFGACNDSQRLIYTAFLQSGMRDEELAYLEKIDLYWNGGCPYIDINEKPTYNWIPKWYQLRKIFIPVDLYHAMDEHRKLPRLVSSPWMFPTSSGKRNRKLLQAAQRIAKRAGLKPREVTLHDFRRTFATTCLRRGMDIPTVKKQMGHSPTSNAIWKYVEALAEGERSRKVAEVWSKVPKIEQPAIATIQ